MKNEQYYVEIAVKAAQRPAFKLSEKARKENQALPVWKNDHIEYEIPKYTQSTPSC